MSTKNISPEALTNKIFIIRDQKVMIDRDLAELYGVETRALNQAVRRNKDRFPEDFMFVLTRDEVITNCDNLSTQVFSQRPSLHGTGSCHALRHTSQ